MTIADLINEVKQSRNKVIPTSYILSRLRELESGYNMMHDEIPIYPPRSVKTMTGRIRRVGD